jgi:hypothetical protein
MESLSVGMHGKWVFGIDIDGHPVYVLSELIE